MATTTPTKVQPKVGQRLRRQEDPRLLTGTATYVDDIKKPGMLYAAIFAHNKLQYIRGPLRL